MKKIGLLAVYVFCTILCGQRAHAQYAASMFLQDITGKPIDVITGYEIYGSDSYPEAYTLSTLFVPGGKYISNVMIKVSLTDHNVLFKNAEGAEMIALTPIEEIQFTEKGKTVTLHKFKSETDAKIPNKFYKVLAVSGDMLLLKLPVLDHTDVKDYGSATVRRTYETHFLFFVGDKQKGSVKKIDNPNDVLAFVPENKLSKAGDYLKTHKLSVRKEAELMDFFSFYGSL